MGSPRGPKALWGLPLVGCGLVALFLLPAAFFIPGTLVVTGFMVALAYLAGGFSRLKKPTPGAIAIGVVSALILYTVFYGGNLAITALQIPGLSTSSEGPIYSLIASPANPLALQLGVLAFDAAGYESFFRGVVQERLQQRLGVGAAPVVAALDAALHVATFNPLWVATTFVADLAWGLTYYYGKDLSTNLTSHFVWDVAIFIIRPIR